MTILKAEKRDLGVKAKKLRREGFVTGILYGREMDDSIPLKFDEKDATRFIKDCREGHQVTLDVDGEKISALVKGIDYNPMQKQIFSMDFQALVKGEKVAAVAQVKLLNEDAAKGYVLQELSEIHYKADPAHLVEEIVIDFAKDPELKAVHVADLEMCKNPAIDVTTPADALIVHVTDHLNNGPVEEETDEDAEETAEA